MEQKNNVYLCGGTFFTQLIRFKSNTSTPNDRVIGKKEIYTEATIMKKLLSIFYLEEFESSDNTIKTNTSSYKSCKSNLEKYAKFSDLSLKSNFDKNIKGCNSKALIMTKGFLNDCLVSNKKDELVKCLLDMIEQDVEIDDYEEFFINGNEKPTLKCDIKNMETFYFEPFILGVWHFIIMKRSNDNKKGESTYKSWYPDVNSCYSGNIGIKRNIKVLEFFVDEAVCEEEEAEIPYEEEIPYETEYEINENCKTQHIENVNVVNQTGDNNININNTGVLNITL